MIVRKLRLQRGWSQDHLAHLTGLSVRTIQRIERGQNASLESAKALASVFEVDISTFIENEAPNMNERASITQEEIEALRWAKHMKDLYEGLFAYFIVAAAIILTFAIKAPHKLQEPVLYLALGGAALGPILQALIAFEVIRPPLDRFEKKLAEKKLKRKL